MKEYVTKAAQGRIIRALDRTQFTALAFKITYADDKDAFAEIVFRDRPDYVFVIGEAGADAPWGARLFTCTMTPGSVRFHEKDGANNWSELTNCIQSWARNIRDELSEIQNTPNVDFEKFREEIIKKIESLKAGTNEHFSPEEQSKLSDRISKLENDFKILKERDEIREKEFSSLSRELKSLKKSLKTTPKKTWYRMASGKLLNIGERIISSAGGQRVIEKITDRLLG